MRFDVARIERALASADPAFGARLPFTIAFDQTELPAIIRGLDSILATLGGFRAS